MEPRNQGYLLGICRMSSWGSAISNLLSKLLIDFYKFYLTID